MNPRIGRQTSFARHSVRSLEKKGLLKGSILSGVLLIAITITATAIVVTMVNDVVQQGNSYNTFDQAKQLLSVVNSVIDELSLEDQGAMRVLDLRTFGGQLIVSGKEDRIKFQMDAPVSGIEPGTRMKEGDYIISYGPEMKAYESDIDNDGNEDLILENDGVLFAVKKLGNASSYAFVNTTGMITMIKNKITDTTITPKSGILISGMDNSSYGLGYTELTSAGDFITSSGIRFVMNSASGLHYEALFTLSGASDFIELEIRHIR